MRIKDSGGWDMAGGLELIWSFKTSTTGVLFVDSPTGTISSGITSSVCIVDAFVAILSVAASQIGTTAQGKVRIDSVVFNSRPMTILCEDMIETQVTHA